ncbi:hypothetical protein [Streptomyces sp. NBC_00539]|uniref:hypothetical protein n=1 Tax=Streptomyces sp. NBC_00539 TaxID=2975770 RepID=UPI002E81CD1C|nr:hypothetical protein [Streptomyces sp. NBC_00539]WUC64067.1 hypothetical protein OG861_07350 [Streptomyces sp. NBC_00539]
MSAARPPEPADEDGEPSGGAQRHPSDPGRRRGLLARMYSWQGLLGTLITAVAAVVVALIARTPGEPHPAPTPSPASASPTTRPPVTGPVVGIHLTREHDDPAAPAPAVLVDFEGTVTGLDAGSTVFALVRRPDERSSWPAALAEVDRRNGTWKAVVHVPRPQPPLVMTAGVISSDFGAAQPPGVVQPPYVPAPSPGGPELERLREDGPSAAGVETSAPFRSVAPETPRPAVSASR